jgi:ammonia channel protein AmtB
METPINLLPSPSEADRLTGKLNLDVGSNPTQPLLTIMLKQIYILASVFLWCFVVAYIATLFMKAILGIQ